ncbi:MAG TPA: molybdate ABC transporter substrate-binding protein [Candidatus Paenalcaligenes intestinipullorum]|uniref:Molybdate ABC transporter substrate-binding protein n=1 Tax=Candidatus Paenalcaligenes intestinipullorum TaxID=2838718 RepID=A0A9D2REA0_9BURK|nr:molybdate ABC transporter substrate-binding protein [Candidatus Paenalcaligenes intestinipullorum]
MKHTSYSIFKKWFAAAAVASAFALSATTHAADLTVSAAASLTNAFEEVGAAFAAKQKDTEVVNSFAASDVLLQQIISGAPVDVFASADQKAMDKAVEADVVEADTRVNFVQNEVVLIVPNDNPRNITGLESLKNKDVTSIALGNPASVPVGRYTQGALEKAGEWDTVKKHEVLGENVRQVLDYVSRGEVDAGFVFATDAAAAKDKVKVIETLETVTPVTYPIAVVKRDGVNSTAQAYIDFVLSEEGQDILAKYGFAKP